MTLYKNNDAYTLKVTRTFDDVEKMRSCWEQFNEHPNSDIDRFLTFVDNRSEVLGPHVITVLKADEPKLIIAGRIEHSTLELKIGYKTLLKPKLRTLAIIYGGILGEAEDDTAVRQAMIEILGTLSRGEVELVKLSHLRQESLVHRLAKEMPPAICRDNVSLQNIHWRIALPETSADYFDNLKKRVRKNLRRASRSLEKKYPTGVSIKCFQKIEDVPQFINDAEIIAKKSYQRAIGGGFVADDVRIKLVELEARRNRLLAFILYIDGIPVAYDRGTLYSKTFFWGDGGFDPDYKDIEPGTNMLVHIINKLYEHNIKYVDFGFGDAFYKQLYCNECWQEETVYIFAPKPKTVAINFIRSATIALAKYLEAILKKTKLLDKIKSYWRQSLSNRETA